MYIYPKITRGERSDLVIYGTQAGKIQGGTWTYVLLFLLPLNNSVCLTIQITQFFIFKLSVQREKRKGKLYPLSSMPIS
jgi:hypothetical protein